MSDETRVACWAAATADEQGWHLAIRHRVFVEEQRVMVFTDVDDWDRHPDTIHVLGARGAAVAGAVRLYETGAGRQWKGDRLAVLPGHRASMVGARLVQFAVTTAAARGGDEMIAHIQVPNVRFFERLGWGRAGPVVPYYGIDHQPMVIDLATVGPTPVGGAPDLARLRLAIEPLEECPLLV